MRYNFLPQLSYVDNTQLNPGTGGDMVRSTDVGGVKTQHAKIAFGGTGVATTVDNLNPLPVINPAEGVVSVGNSTVVNLAANAVFTGAAENILIYANIKTTIYSSHASATNGLTFQQSHDGILWIPLSDAYTVPALVQRPFSIPPNMMWYRVVYTNGPTATSQIAIQTVYHKSNKQPSSVRPQDGRSNDNDFVEVLSALLGYNSLADAWNRVGITNAIAGGNENLLDRLKVNAALRMIDSAQPSGSKLVNVTGSQALGLDVNTGTDITAPTAMPAGGLGMRGWLSAIWTKINSSLAVTGTFFQATQPVSGTFFQATQPVSLATNTPDVTDRAARLLGVLSAGTNAIGNINELRAATLTVSVTSASGVAATLTIPAVAAQFHYITGLTIQIYATAARVGAAAPVVVTTTNIQGSPAYTFETAQAIGTNTPPQGLTNGVLKSAVSGTATTIVAPIATAGIWRITAYYFTSV